MQIQIIWLLQKPTDLNLHCLQRQYISGFSMTRVKRWLAIITCITWKLHVDVNQGLGNLQNFITVKISISLQWNYLMLHPGGSVGCALRLETRRLRVQPPPRSATFFRGDWLWNIFYGHSLPSADSRRAVVNFWQKECAQYWSTA